MYDFFQFETRFVLNVTFRLDAMSFRSERDDAPARQRHTYTAHFYIGVRVVISYNILTGTGPGKYGIYGYCSTLCEG